MCIMTICDSFVYRVLMHISFTVIFNVLVLCTVYLMCILSLFISSKEDNINLDDDDDDDFINRTLKNRVTKCSTYKQQTEI